jgi:dynein intermediate chain 2, axonemal
MLWWDTRKLGEPTDRLQVVIFFATCSVSAVCFVQSYRWCSVWSCLQLDDWTGRILGGSSMEYNTEAGPAKYLVGTEQGVVLNINLRKRKSNDCVVAMDMGSGKHHGPIYSIQVRLSRFGRLLGSSPQCLCWFRASATQATASSS